MLDALITASSHFLSVSSVAYLFLGTVIGLLFGTIPGLGGPTALALLIPLTFGMDSGAAMVLCGGIMGAVPFGGSITAILINTPGTAPNAATCFDGYPLAQQGKAGLAIGAAAAASSIGGLIGIAILFASIPVAREFVLLFAPPEFFMLAVLGLCAIAVSTEGRFLRGLIAAGVGLMISFIGYDDVGGGGTRYTFGYEYLWDGVPLVPALIGLFAVAQSIELFVAGGSISEDPTRVRITRVMDGVWAVFRHWTILLRGSVIGSIVGAIPGIGGTVAAFLSYTTTVQVSKGANNFGKGDIRGVIAPEASNNAKEGGSLIPTIAFGIPGSAEMAVFLGLLVLHGLQPGPQLLLHNVDVVLTLILALSFSSVLASIIGLMSARRMVLLTLIDVNLLVPIIVSVAIVGSYALKSNIYDAVLTALFGMIGYLMARFDFPRLPLVIAMFLGAVAETSYRQSLMISTGDWRIFFDRGISLFLFVLVVFSLLWPVIKLTLARMRRRT